MTRRVVSTRRAHLDIDEAVTHYLDEGAQTVALDFIDAVQDTIELLAAHPSLGSTRFAVETGIAELRSVALRRFPYIVFYTDDDDAVRVHRVLHSRRDIPAELHDL
ncbi:type II toxin-antitoxin system RelE/ParE family toxin [Labedella endophytica]|uniref:Type II toxin-antitoxin system RelE/ParE family toxin n=1 Tax=Labedella endophytica TaxID=1523160 RepID=A0A3S0VH17_9MICO|nr:type II toxin-antitoxin system RelE/ParE family toxin [Labedella endophytica]RUR01722.1 type II toxin-antitoxin system RelE/ParE family toxin [Labedella endophytica]